jgi:hypothetical protein
MRATFISSFGQRRQPDVDTCADELKATLKRRHECLDGPQPESDGEDLEEADGLGGNGHAVANDQAGQPEIGSEQLACTRVCIRNDQSQ